jgi:hypothetical protein
VWTHYSAPGAGWQPPFERIGTVFSGAPTGNGLSNAWWVEPDELLPGEVTAAGVIAVGRCSRRSFQREAEPAKGELYSSSDWRYQAAALTGAAAKWIAERRRERVTRWLPDPGGMT